MRPLLKKKEIYIHQKSCFTFLLYKDFLEFSSFSSTKGNLLRTKWFKGRIVTVLGWWPSGLPFSVFLSFCIIICVLVLCVSLELFYWWFDLDLFIGFPPCLCPLSPSLCLCLCVYVCLVSLRHVYLFPQPITSALFLSLPHVPSLPLVCHSSTPTSCFNVKVMCPCSVCLVYLCQLCFPVCLSVCSVYHLTV